MKAKKILYTLLFLVGFVTITDAQTGEKIKGNREVTIQQTYVNDFNTIVIKNDFEVKLVFNNKTSVEVETDNNLHDVINIDVVAGVLTISTNNRIASKKKLEITINYSENLNNIELYDDAEINSLTSLELDYLDLKVENSARAFLTVRSNIFNFKALDKSKSRLNITADTTSFALGGNSKLDAYIAGKVADYDIYSGANATIEGNAQIANLKLNNFAKFIGKEYSITDANVLVEEKSDATLNITEILTLNASGATETYIYGAPKINLETFADTAKLQKKK